MAHRYRTPLTGLRRIRLLAVSVGVFLTLAPAHADIDSEMQDMFNAMGAVGNVTEPGAFRGQTRNLYTGGSLTMRVPQRNFQVFSATGPSFKSSCGGIDLYGGSFSFINSDQLVAMLQNIGSVAVTQAFMLALDSISPEIGKTMAKMQEWAQKFNSMSVNSCEAGKALFDGVMGKTNEAKGHACRAIKNGDGTTPDYAKGWFDCNSQGAGATVAAAQAADPNVKKATFIEGNVMWRTLKNVNGIDDATRELLMSFTGTVILTRMGTGTDEQPVVEDKERTLTSIGQLMDGHGMEDADGNISLNVLSCQADPDCMNPVPVSRQVKSFRRYTSDAMFAIADSMIDRGEISGASIGFVNNTRLPLKRMLDVTTQVDRVTAYSAINNWRDAIAMDLAREFLIRSLSDARRMMRTGTVSAIEREYLDQIGRSVDARIAQVMAETQNQLTKETAMNQVAGYLEQMNRVMWSGAPSPLRASLLFQ